VYDVVAPETVESVPGPLRDHVMAPVPPVRVATYATAAAPASTVVGPSIRIDAS
jgi:hypothetical protein